MDYKEKDSKSPDILLLNKKREETLATFMDRVRIEQNLGTAPLTYAGRLDPMADGLMLVLKDSARFDKDTYLSLEKEYEFEVLFGIATDTYDTLGRIEAHTMQTPDIGLIKSALKKLPAKKRRYPPYSSKPIQGKPLFMHAREESLPEELPYQPGVITNLVLKELRTVSLGEAARSIITDIQKVTGDFRQPVITDDWDEVKEMYSDQPVTICTCSAAVTSGTYIRSIAHELGNMVGVPALAYRITRTRIGPYVLEESM